MPAGSTYTPIATNTLGSASGSVTFSSISGSYTDIVLVANVQRATTAENPSLTLRFNSDTGTNYSMTNLVGSGSTASSSRQSSQNMMNFSYFSMASASNTFSTFILNMMNYSNSTTYKTVVGRSGDAAGGTQATAGLWRSTSAITSVTITNDGSPTNFSAGSSWTLYGISAA
jgi:hypothetical protein